MAATVINGVFLDDQMTWQSASIGQASTGICIIPNTQNVPITLQSAVMSGTFAADYVIPGGQLPVTLNPGQSALLQVTFTPSGAGLRNALLTVTTNNPYTPTVIMGGTAAGSAIGQPFPSRIVFPNTKVGQTTIFANVIIVNPRNAAITVTNVTMATGVNFSLTGVPIVPFVLNPGQATVAFNVLFQPTVVGNLGDQISVITAAGTGGTGVSGVGTTLQSAFNLSGGTEGTLFAFPGAGAPVILLGNPNDFSSEEPGSFSKLHDFGAPTVEKKLWRIKGRYEDLGPAVVTFTVKGRRVGKSDEVITVNVNIGTAFADGWIREFTSDAVETGEIIQITVSRAANGGPVSLVDFFPEYDIGGQVIGGT